MSKIKLFLIAMLISALLGGIAIRNFFPKVEIKVREIKPTVHELELFAMKMSKGTIDSLQRVIDAGPKIIYRDIIIEGETITDSFPVFPIGFKDITNEELWEKEFINENRDNDSLKFITKDSVRVISYVDTLGNPYIGYDFFHSSIENLSLTVTPKIREIEYIDRFSLFINGGFIIDKKKVIKNEVIFNEYNAGLTTDIGIVLNEQFILSPSLTITNNYTSYGLKFGTYILRIGKCKKGIKK